MGACRPRQVEKVYPLRRYIGKKRTMELKTFKTFRQYELIVEDTARLSDRRQTVNNLYLSANSLLLGGSAILVQQGTLKNGFPILLIVPLVLAGGFLCVDWWRLLRNYRKLLNLRFGLLKEIEARDDFPGPIATYQREEKLYPADPRKSRFGFSGLELNLPWIFIALYVLTVIGTIVLNYSAIVSRFSQWGISLPH
jgi:hypothetical protein